MKYPAMEHPHRFIWDFWYFYDVATSIFHVFYLNADPALAPEEKHHYVSQVGYGVTRDFITMDWLSDSTLIANADSWDNTSIWTGDVIRIKDGFLMFYTSRDRNHSDGLTQNIGAAFADRIDSHQWQRVPQIRIVPDSTFYEPHTVAGDITFHAWRDPFLFIDHGTAYMLVAAKVLKGAIGENAAVGLLRAKNKQLSEWEALPPLYSPGFYSEIEVPQIYLNQVGEHTLVYSNHAKYDNAPSTQRQGGLHEVKTQLKGSLNQHLPRVVLPESEDLYACRVIPELGGEVVGFNLKTGGLQRSGVKCQLASVDRDFSKFGLMP